MSLNFEHFIPYYFGLNVAFYAVVSLNTWKEQSDLGMHCLHMLLCQTLWCLKF